MKEEEYRNVRFLVDAVSECLERMIAEKAPEEEIKAARSKLAEYQNRLADIVKNATEEERCAIFKSVAESVTHLS